MLRQAALFVFLALGCSLALAQDVPRVDSTGKHAGVYICIPEASGGLRYDAQAKEWRNAKFKTGDNVIFRLKDSGGRQTLAVSPETPGVVYEVTVNIPSEQEPQNCYPRSGSGVLVELGRIMCFSFGTIYQLNFTSMRYMDIYSYGYIDGVDAVGNTPSITVGKCSKISDS